MTFERHIKAMADFCEGKRPDNQCLFGIDANGALVCDESAGANGGSLQGDYQDQIQFRGGTTRIEIETRVYSRTVDVMRCDEVSYSVIHGQAIATIKRMQAELGKGLDGGIEALYEVDAQINAIQTTIRHLKVLSRRMRWDSEYAEHDMVWNDETGRYVDGGTK